LIRGTARMEFENIKSGIKNTPLDTTRVDNDIYFEAVVKKDVIGDIVRLFEHAMGKPAWPSKERLAKEARSLADKFGGLRKGQTLFFLNKDGVSLFAMLWPWQDGERITIRFGKA